MRMKMFAAETFDAAKALIAAEMGDDAIILSEREVEGGVEVRAATDKPLGGQAANRPVFLRQADDPLPQTTQENPIGQRIRDALTWHGAPKRFADRAADARRFDVTDPAEALASGLETLIKCAPIGLRPVRDILLVGPPGHGRTSTAAKLARRAAVAGKKLIPIAADFDATAGGPQLSSYLTEEKHLVQVAPTPDALFSVLDNIRLRHGRCVIDLPSIVPFDHEDMARLKDLAGAIGAEPVLVLSAEGHPEDLADAARAFARAGVKRAILTKLDVARRRGGAVSGIASANIAFSHIAVTPFIGGGLVPAAPARLAALLMEDAPGQDALRGAA